MMKVQFPFFQCLVHHRRFFAEWHIFIVKQKKYMHCGKIIKNL